MKPSALAYTRVRLRDRIRRRFQAETAIPRKLLTVTLVSLIVALFSASLFPLGAWQQAAPDTPGAPVTLDGETLLRLIEKGDHLSAEARAAEVTGRIESVAANRAIPVSSIHFVNVNTAGGMSVILASGTLLLGISDADAAAAGCTREELAADYAGRLQRAIQKYRDEWSPKKLFKAGAKSLAITLFCAALWIAFRRAQGRIRTRILRWSQSRLSTTKLFSSGIFSAGQISRAVLQLVRVLGWAVALVLLNAWLSLLLSFFPGTHSAIISVYSWIFSPLNVMWQAFVAYLPDMFFALVIAGLTRVAIKINALLFHEIENGRIKLEGFHTDWAGPTSKLVRATILALAVVVVFPYLPGSKSPAFQGVSIFVGVLLSLGSSSAVSNVIAGTIITYMRPFRVGDRVEIANIMGDVTEKSLLVTRLRTIKNETITIPNANILNTQIRNFSTEAKTEGLILHTSVTIGYDAPWRTVHELLLDAARSTELILAEPKPFILQTALNDFCVSYELNAYTAEANRMIDIYSALHQNIQDKFNKAGMEICTPHITAIRDANTIAIPEQYRPEGYVAPSFRVSVKGAPPIENRTGPAV